MLLLYSSLYNSYKHQLMSDIYVIVRILACLIHKNYFLLGSILKFSTDQTNIKP